MISIEVQGEQFDLYANTRIELEYINPAFAPAGEDGSFGYPFNVPGTSQNHRLTGFAYNLQKRDVLGISLPAKIALFGLPIADGILKLTYPVSRESIRVFIVVNSFADAVKDQSLRSVDYGDEDYISIVGSAQNAYMNARLIPGSDRVAFYPSMAYLRQNPYESGSFNAFYREIVPHPYIHFLYKRIIQHFGYTFEDAFFLPDDLQHLTLYHHRHVEFDPDASMFVLNIQRLVPDIDVADFIKALDSLFNSKIYVGNRRKNVKLLPLQSLLDATWTDWTDKADSKYSVEPYDPEGFTLQFAWSDIDDFHEKIYEEGWQLLMTGNSVYVWQDKTTVGNFSELADVDPLPSSNQHRTVWVEDAKVFFYEDNGQWLRYNWHFVDYEGDPFTNPSPQTNGVYWDADTQQYWMYLVYEFLNPNPVWRQFSYKRTDELEIGDKNTPITAKAHPVELFYAEQRHPLPCSKIQVTGNDVDGQNAEEVDEDKSIRLLIYRGLDATAYPGVRMPLATPDEYDTRGALVGTHSLRWSGPRGLYEKFWKRWLDFLASTRKVQRRLRLTAADLFNLDLTRQIRIENINYLIGKINVAITMTGISPARCELYTVGSGTEAAMATVSGSAPAGGIGVMAIESTNIVG